MGIINFVGNLRKMSGKVNSTYFEAAGALRTADTLRKNDNGMKLIQVIRAAVMPETLLMGLATVLAGTAIAAVRDAVHLLPAFLSLLFVAASQCASNSTYLFNDLRNHRGNSAEAEVSGSLIAKENVELYGILKMIAGATTIFASTIGLILASYSGAWTILVGALVFILIYLNVQGSLPLVSTPFGPIITYLIFGPIGVVGSFLLQFSDSSFALVSWFDIGPAIYLGLSVGFLASNVHLAIEYQNYRVNLLTFRTSIVTDMGRKFTRFLVLASGFGMWIFFYLMTKSSYCRYPVIDMIAPSAAVVVNCILWYRMRRYSPGNIGLSPSEIAIWNMMVVVVVTLVLFLIIGPPAPYVRGEL